MNNTPTTTLKVRIIERPHGWLSWKYTLATYFSDLPAGTVFGFAEDRLARKVSISEAENLLTPTRRTMTLPPELEVFILTEEELDRLRAQGIDV